MTEIIPGERFGKLTITGVSEPHYTKSGRKIEMVICNCECGNQKIVSINHLRSGHTKSCGCIARETKKQTIKHASKKAQENKLQRRESLIGKRFGKWTVIGLDEEKSGLKTARCVCDCGAENVVTINNLIRKLSTECAICGQLKGTESFKGRECFDGTALCKLTQKKRVDNTTGIKGVWFDKRSGKYIAEIKLSGKKHYIGSFYDIDSARKARERAEEELFDPVLLEHGRKTTGERRESNG